MLENVCSGPERVSTRRSKVREPVPPPTREKMAAWMSEKSMRRGCLETKKSCLSRMKRSPWTAFRLALMPGWSAVDLKPPTPMIFLPVRPLKMADTTSYVGFS